MRTAGLAALLAVAVAAGCGSTRSAPRDDPGAFAVKVVGLIVRNQYPKAWGDLHPEDQKVAPLDEYVACETQSPILLLPTSVTVVGVNDRAVALGDGRTLPSKAIRLVIVFPGEKHVLVRTVHVVAAGRRWTWVLPPARFRDYRADRCRDAAPPPVPET